MIVKLTNGLLGYSREYRAGRRTGIVSRLLIMQLKTVFQHMAENTLALLRHFVDSESALPQLSSVLPHMPQITYLTILGKWFFMYSFSFASLFYTTLWVISMTVSFFRHDTPSSLGEFVKTQGHGLKNVIFSTISPILGANFVALIMTKILDKSLSWFSGETLPIVLYGPPSIAGMYVLL